MLENLGKHLNNIWLIRFQPTHHCISVFQHVVLIDSSKKKKKSWITHFYSCSLVPEDNLITSQLFSQMIYKKL
jgi:hypothetical protein